MRVSIDAEQKFRPLDEKEEKNTDDKTSDLASTQPSPSPSSLEDSTEKKKPVLCKLSLDNEEIQVNSGYTFIDR